jgi:hypothetical protein
MISLPHSFDVLFIVRRRRRRSLLLLLLTIPELTPLIVHGVIASLMSSLHDGRSRTRHTRYPRGLRCIRAICIEAHGLLMISTSSYHTPIFAPGTEAEVSSDDGSPIFAPGAEAKVSSDDGSPIFAPGAEAKVSSDDGSAIRAPGSQVVTVGRGDRFSSRLCCVFHGRIGRCVLLLGWRRKNGLLLRKVRGHG